MAFRLSTALRNALLEKEATVNEISVHLNTITFGDGDGASGRDTINDSGAGLGNHAPGDKLTIVGSTSNDGTYEILSVADSLIEVAADSFTAEVADANTVVLASCRGGSFNDIFRNGVMRIYNGTQPATADMTEATSTLLVEISLAGSVANPFVSGDPDNGINFGETAIDGVLGKAAGEQWQGEAVASDQAGWFRFYPNDRDNHMGDATTTKDKIRFDGAVSQSGAELNMSSVSIISGGVTTIDSVAVTLPTQ